MSSRVPPSSVFGGRPAGFRRKTRSGAESMVGRIDCAPGGTRQRLNHEDRKDLKEAVLSGLCGLRGFCFIAPRPRKSFLFHNPRPPASALPIQLLDFGRVVPGEGAVHSRPNADWAIVFGEWRDGICKVLSKRSAFGDLPLHQEGLREFALSANLESPKVPIPRPVWGLWFRLPPKL
jgi:hypothetical protein